MTRVELMQIAAEAGWTLPEHGTPAVKTPPGVLSAIEKRLRDYFATDAGKVALSRAPKHLVVTGEPVGRREVGEEMRGIRTTEDVAVERLMTEFRLMRGEGVGQED